MLEDTTLLRLLIKSSVSLLPPVADNTRKLIFVALWTLVSTAKKNNPLPARVHLGITPFCIPVAFCVKYFLRGSSLRTDRPPPQVAHETLTSANRGRRRKRQLVSEVKRKTHMKTASERGLASEGHIHTCIHTPEYWWSHSPSLPRRETQCLRCEENWICAPTFSLLCCCSALLFHLWPKRHSSALLGWGNPHVTPPSVQQHSPSSTFNIITPVISLWGDLESAKSAQEQPPSETTRCCVNFKKDLLHFFLYISHRRTLFFTSTSGGRRLLLSELWGRFPSVSHLCIWLSVRGDFLMNVNMQQCIILEEEKCEYCNTPGLNIDYRCWLCPN